MVALVDRYITEIASPVLESVQTMDLNSLNRKELQSLAKDHALKANGTNAELIEALRNKLEQLVSSETSEGASHPVYDSEDSPATGRVIRLPNHRMPRSSFEPEEKEKLEHLQANHMESTEVTASLDRSQEEIIAAQSSVDVAKCPVDQNNDPEATSYSAPIFGFANREKRKYILQKRKAARAAEPLKEADHSTLQRGFRSTSLSKVYVRDKPELREPDSAVVHEVLKNPQIVPLSISAVSKSLAFKSSSLGKVHVREESESNIQTRGLCF